MASQLTTRTENNSRSLLALLLTRFLFFFPSSLCLSASFSSSLWPHLSLFLFNLSIFCIFIPPPPLFFLHLRSPFLPLLLLSPLLLSLFSRSSMHPRPCGPGEVAGWQKLDPLVSQVPYLTYEVPPRTGAGSAGVCARARAGVLGLRSRGQSKVLEDDALDTLWGGEEEVTEMKWEHNLAPLGRMEGSGGPHRLRWLRLLLELD